MISLIVPCYNEEAILEKFYQEITELLQTCMYSYEIIFINDGSQDKTLDLIKNLSFNHHHIKYISFSRNFGKEAAMLAGLRFAIGDIIIIMDADLQHPPSLIPELVKGYEEGYDQVIAKRNRKGDSFIRSVQAKLFYKLINKFVDVTLTDGIGDFRLLSRRAVDSLLSLSEYNRFSKGLFSWIGFKEKIIEYENVVREEGESKWSFSKLLNYAIDGMMSFNNKPLRMSIYLGLFVTLLGIIYILYTFFGILLHGIDEPGYFTIVSAILLFGGIQLICLGVIGEYIGRIYYETKRRPHYIIEENNYYQDQAEARSILDKVQR